MNRREYKTDELLVYLIKAQQASQYVSRALVQHKTQPRTHQRPHAMIENLRQGLRSFNNSLPAHIKTNRKSHVL